MPFQCPDCAQFILQDDRIQRNQSRITWVLLLSFATMLVEITMGHWAGSMALIADGWHMGSHVGALFISLLAYRLTRNIKLQPRLSFGAGKLLPLGGFTSAVILGVLAVLILLESAERLTNPVPIQYGEAIMVAGIGLVVNLISAFLLHTGEGHDHHHHGHAHHHDHDQHDPSCHQVHDYNIRSAFLHVVADAITSVLAILALLTAWKLNWNFMDPVMGVVGSIVIFSWAVQLCRATGWELLDAHLESLDTDKVVARFAKEDVKVLDLHAWRIAPKAAACEIVVESKIRKGPDFYRQILQKEFFLQHVVVEEKFP